MQLIKTVVKAAGQKVCRSAVLCGSLILERTKNIPLCHSNSCSTGQLWVDHTIQENDHRGRNLSSTFSPKKLQSNTDVWESFYRWYYKSTSCNQTLKYNSKITLNIKSRCTHSVKKNIIKLLILIQQCVSTNYIPNLGLWSPPKGPEMINNRGKEGKIKFSFINLYLFFGLSLIFANFFPQNILLYISALTEGAPTHNDHIYIAMFSTSPRIHRIHYLMSNARRAIVTTNPTTRVCCNTTWGQL